MDKKYLSLIAYSESFLEKYGDTYRGVGWTRNQKYADALNRVMLEMIKQDTPGKVTLLDFGCGASHLYEYILRHDFDNIEYSGLDLSEKFLALSRSKFPSVRYYQLDILDDRSDLPVFDYIVLKGIFNSKCQLSFEEMLEYFKAVVGKAFDKARIGIAFNVMSKHVDWERDDLFHLPLDMLANYLTKELTRNYVIRNDYGLYEYTTYVYKQAIIAND